MESPRNISIKDYTYELPAERIALHPLPERDASKLLLYREGKISEDVFKNIAGFIPEGSLVVFNNTKVINARIRFRRHTGGVVEIFCLEPAGDLREYQQVMSQQGTSVWKCFAGNAAKWKDEESLMLAIPSHDGSDEIQVKAEKLSRHADHYIIRFSWTPPQLHFAEILDKAGDVPLPPYIKRQTIDEDKGRYQTVYAEQEGSVAAPTAGLHFTPQILANLSAKSVQPVYVTLHVGAGTFKPVKAETMEGHDMHAEWMDVDANSIRSLMQDDRGIVAVGTTSLRTIESLYWMGVKAALSPGLTELSLAQWDVYESPLVDARFTRKEALQALLNWMQAHGRENIFAQTQLLISPGYRFRVAQALVTNFHQPESTLLLLVAAAVGKQWRDIYAYAMSHGFRFLSYGDGSYLEFSEEAIMAES